MKIIGAKDFENSSAETGGKTKGLITLYQNNFLVPDFYFLDQSGIDLIQSDEHALEKVLSDWKIDNKINAKDLWAVRSSAGAEDGQEKSFAGQYQTVLNVNFDALSTAIHTVINSYNLRSEYVKGANENGLIIQKMLRPDFSGILFSRDPLKHYNNQPVINIVPGLGEKLVAGVLSGMRIDFEEGKPSYLDSNEAIEGEVFLDGELKELSCSEDEIKNAIEPHIESLLTGISKMEVQLDTALDFEFAIQDGKFYWLQMRPITTRKLEHSFIVWDNTSVEANYPGVTLPLSISFVQKTFYKAYDGGGKSIGFNSKVLSANKHLLANMCGEIEGALYYNVTAWQSLLYLMPLGNNFSKKLPKLWGMDAAPFSPPEERHSSFDKFKISIQLILKLIFSKRLEKRYEQLQNESMKSFESTDLSKESFEELIVRYKKMEDNLGDNWIAPVLNGFYAMIAFTVLKRKVEKSSIYKTHPNFVNDILYSEGDVISVKLVHDFQYLLAKITDNEKLKALFKNSEANEVLNNLAKNFKDFYQKICSYIEIYGNRTDQGELKMETVTYKQNPALFIAYIQSNLKGFIPKKKQMASFDSNKIIRGHYPYNFIQRWLFKKLIKSAVKRIKTRENYRFMRTDIFAIIRILFLQMGKALEKEGIIESEKAIFYLELNELLDVTIQNQFRDLVAKRKAAYVLFVSSKRTSRYIECENKFIPIEPTDINIKGNELKGTGCCSGIVEGRVKIIDENTDLNRDFTDCILIAKYFEPGWISLFSQAKATISERGNLLSHAAIICRELNVPSIVGVKGLTKKIKNNDFISMDGATGIIKLKADEEV